MKFFKKIHNKIGSILDINKETSDTLRELVDYINNLSKSIEHRKNIKTRQVLIEKFNKDDIKTLGVSD